MPDACKKAMAEITGPILAITFVLLSVFVPVAFIPGISGQLFRQFAVAVSVSMLISALNALTLSPALCAVLLTRGQQSRGPMRYVLGAIDKARDGYVAVVRRLVRVAVVGVVVVAGVLAASAWLFQQDAAELSAGGGSGRDLRRAAASRRRLDQPHRGGGQAGRRHRPADPRRRRRAVGGRAEFHRLRRIVEPGLLRHPAQALRGSAPTRRRAPTRSSPGCARNWRRSRAPSRFRSICRRSSASATPAASSTCSRRCRASRQPTSPRCCAGSWSRPTSSPSSPACSAPTPPTRRRSISTSIATRPRCWASRSATFSTPCNRRWAATTSTTSTFSAAPGRSTSRPRRRFATASRTSTASMCATRRRDGADPRAWPRRSSCRGRRRWCATTASAARW